MSQSTGTWWVPALGQVAAPLGISGEGSLTWSDGGLRLTVQVEKPVAQR